MGRNPNGNPFNFCLKSNYDKEITSLRRCAPANLRPPLDIRRLSIFIRCITRVNQHDCDWLCRASISSKSSSFSRHPRWAQKEKRASSPQRVQRQTRATQAQRAQLSSEKEKGFRSACWAGIQIISFCLCCVSRLQQCIVCLVYLHFYSFFRISSRLAGAGLQTPPPPIIETREIRSGAEQQTPWDDERKHEYPHKKEAGNAHRKRLRTSQRWDHHRDQVEKLVNELKEEHGVVRHGPDKTQGRQDPDCHPQAADKRNDVAIRYSVREHCCNCLHWPKESTERDPPGA